MIWTVNYLGVGGYVTPPVDLNNYATYRYEKLHTNKKIVFFLDMNIDFLCHRFENNYRLKCEQVDKRPKIDLLEKYFSRTSVVA